jgi:hypothetical protein
MSFKMNILSRFLKLGLLLSFLFLSPVVYSEGVEVNQTTEQILENLSKQQKPQALIEEEAKKGGLLDSLSQKKSEVDYAHGYLLPEEQQVSEKTGFWDKVSSFITGLFTKSSDKTTGYGQTYIPQEKDPLATGKGGINLDFFKAVEDTHETVKDSYLPQAIKEDNLNLTPEEEAAFQALTPEEKEVFFQLTPEQRKMYLFLSRKDREEYLTSIGWTRVSGGTRGSWIRPTTSPAQTKPTPTTKPGGGEVSPPTTASGEEYKRYAQSLVSTAGSSCGWSTQGAITTTLKCTNGCAVMIQATPISCLQGKIKSEVYMDFLRSADGNNWLQCVGLVVGMERAFGRNLRSNNAREYCNSLPAGYSYVNKNQIKPQDIVANQTGTWGHVMAVTEVLAGSGGYRVVEANWGVSGAIRANRIISADEIDCVLRAQ